MDLLTPQTQMSTPSPSLGIRSIGALTDNTVQPELLVLPYWTTPQEVAQQQYSSSPATKISSLQEEIPSMNLNEVSKNRCMGGESSGLAPSYEKFNSIRNDAYVTSLLVMR